MNLASSAILTYHSIDDSGSVISVSPRLFRQHMDMLAAAGTPVVPLQQVRITPGAVAITFDDGFCNFLDHALPVLVEHRFPATVFVVSDYCGKQNDWPSQPRGVPCLDLMDWADLRDLPRHGIALGGHSATHAPLTGIWGDLLRREISDSRTMIEELGGAPITTFAYPYGGVNESVRRVVASEYRLACGTSLRLTEPGDDAFDLPRIDAFYLKKGWTVRNLFGPPGRAYLRARGWMRSARVAVAR